MKKLIMKKSIIILSLGALLAVSACKSTPMTKTVDSMSGKREASEARLATAAAQAIAEGKTNEALASYEKLYMHPQAGIFGTNSNNLDIALNFAQLLRKTGNPQRALAVLAPFLRGKFGTPEPIIMNEYAAINIELGNLEKAKEILDKVLGDPDAAKFQADANHLMGVVLDAQGQHKDAEQYFRLALDGWKGDATSVMNNLALCLAAQGMFDESLTMLRQALVMAPQKQEIARNINMVEDLRKSVVPTAPVEIKK